MNSRRSIQDSAGACGGSVCGDWLGAAVTRISSTWSSSVAHLDGTLSRAPASKLGDKTLHEDGEVWQVRCRGVPEESSLFFHLLSSFFCCAFLSWIPFVYPARFDRLLISTSTTRDNCLAVRRVTATRNSPEACVGRSNASILPVHQSRAEEKQQRRRILAIRLFPRTSTPPRSWAGATTDRCLR